MMFDSALSAGMTRRSFVAGAAATAAVLALGASVSLADEGVSSDDVADYVASDENVEGGVEGGMLNWYLSNPVGIEPFAASENNGTMVCHALFDPLTAINNTDGVVTPLAAESWESNEDATQFTFHLREGATFHNGDPVTSADFKYSWERICRADFEPSPSTMGSTISMVKGATEMMAGEADELDIECPDDYTFVVNLTYPFADFPIICSHSVTAPVPAGCTDNEEDYQAFRVAPIGNGPFMMDGEWADGQYIIVKRFDDYWGDRPLIDGINFMIYSDDETAWFEFQSGALDFTVIPSGQYATSLQLYGQADEDGNIANPGSQVLNGLETTVYCLVCNNEDEVMSNKDLRIGISYAVDRQAICDTALEGSRIPVTDFLPPSLDGYQEGTWEHCQANADLEKAAEYLDAAGYPADENGSRGLSITLTTNAGSSNEEIFQMVQAELAEVGIDAQVQTQEWAAYLSALSAGEYQMGRMGFTCEALTAYFFLQDAFSSGASSNYCQYSNPDFEDALTAAASLTDADDRAAAYHEVDAMLAEDFPLIPMFCYTHGFVTSSRVNNLLMNPMGYSRYNHCWLSE